MNKLTEFVMSDKLRSLLIKKDIKRYLNSIQKTKHADAITFYSQLITWSLNEYVRLHRGRLRNLYERGELDEY